MHNHLSFRKKRLSIAEQPLEAIINNIKKQGGIILGKANLDEFAFGYVGKSSVGGQTKNVYDLTKGPGGSSSGTGAAISASLATIGIGTDTGGSIRVPSAVEGLVGLRPSLRLVSQNGIIPLAPTQDTAGPICRKAIDCAKLFNSLVGFDSSSTSNQRVSFENNSSLLTSSSSYQGLFNTPKTYVPMSPSLQGKHIGVVRYMLPNTSTEEGRLVNQAMEQAISKLKSAGAIVDDVEISDLPTVLGAQDYTDGTGKTYGKFASLSGYEFKPSITKYLIGANSVYKSYDDLLNSGKMIPAFANYNKDTSSDAYIQGYNLNTMIRTPYVRQRLENALNNKTMDGTIKGTRYDALAYPTMLGLAAKIGDSPTAGSNNRLSAFTGYPAISLPAATVSYPAYSPNPLNVNIEFISHEFDEPTLFNIAIAFQNPNPIRVAPSTTPKLLASS